MRPLPHMDRRWFLLGSMAAVSGRVSARETLELCNRDEQIGVSSPDFHFLTGRALQHLHDGHSLAFEFQVALALQPRGMALRKAIERFLISYDLWEERFAVTHVRRADRSVSNLMPKAAEAWCLDHVLLSMGDTARDLPLWLRLEIRAEDVSTLARQNAGEVGFDLTALIDLFSRPAKDRQMQWSLETGPLRLRDVAREESRR